MFLVCLPDIIHLDIVQLRLSFFLLEKLFRRWIFFWSSPINAIKSSSHLFYNELERLKWIIVCCSFFQNIWQSWCTSYASIRGPRWWSCCCDVAKECAFVPAHHQHRQRLQRQEQQCEVGERIGGEDLRRFILDKCRPLLLLLVPSSDDAEWTKDW